jgi:tetratricopeptide (TPR) repeat protein
MRGRQMATPTVLALALVASSFVAGQPNRGGGAPASATATDVTLVERVLAARKDYQRALENLREHYQHANDLERLRWVEEELLAFHRISKRPYRLDMDVPPPNLQPAQNIPEANELYRRAMTYKGKGWLTGEYEDNLRRAEILFQQLLTTYPASDKIALTAYHLGDLYESNVFKQYRRAAQYYERCFQWSPNTDTDARFRAAKLYDRTLQERQRAAQLYREVINHDTDPKRVEQARKRLAELTGGGQ